MLYQLSYVGLVNGDVNLCIAGQVDRVTRSLERATGFEPATASLEGWNSTTELRPPPLFSNSPSA